MNSSESLKDILASIIGSAACVYTGQPFDTIKVRMQCVPADAQGGAVKCFVNTYRSEGVLAFWRGSLLAFSGALSENAVAFGLNGFLKRMFDNYSSISSESKSRSFITGSVTGFCTAFVLCPADVIKCRAQLNRAKGGTGNVREIVNNIIRKEGVMGLYTGLHCQILRDIPFYFFFFGSYDLSCYFLRKSFPNLPDSAVFFISGGLAGQVAWTASMPADSVKSIVQTQEIKVPAMTVFRNILNRSGVMGLYNGVGVAIVRAFPANAALFLGYELSRKLM
jgi:solute carrier family 25 (mitochondrial ornithine transporter) member 2/15